MMKCNYYLVNPTNNITILVESQFPSEMHPFVAKKLLEKEKTAEQVGFISNEADNSYDIKVRMSGGEFCGNACMAAAAVYLKKSGSDVNCVRVSMSGCEKIVNVAVEKDNNGGYSCCVDMPKPNSVSEIKAVIDCENVILPIVHYKGISHILYIGKLAKNKSESLIKELAGTVKSDALGIMFVSDDYSEVTPLVYVPAADTLYWENSCASGTAALGEYLLKFDKDKLPLCVSEPGGKLKITDDNGIKLSGGCYIEKYSENVTDV